MILSLNERPTLPRVSRAQDAVRLFLADFNPCSVCCCKATKVVHGDQAIRAWTPEARQLKRFQLQLDSWPSERYANLSSDVVNAPARPKNVASARLDPLPGLDHPFGPEKSTIKSTIGAIHCRDH